MISECLSWMKLKNYSPRTIQATQEVVSRFNGYLWDTAGRKLNEAMEDDLEKYLLYLKESKSPETVLYTAVQLKRFYRFLHKQKIILKDPTVCLSTLRREKTLKDIPSEEAVSVFINAPDEYTYEGIRDRAILELMYSTGMRNTELRRLIISDIDFGQKLVRILEGKNQKSRLIPLGKKPAFYIQRYLEITRPRRFRKHSPQDILFLTRLGTIVSKTNLARIFSKYARQAAHTKKITPHILRHACALHMLRGGAPITIIQELLGHKCLSTTQIYTRLNPKDLRMVHKKHHPVEAGRPLEIRSNK